MYRNKKNVPKDVQNAKAGILANFVKNGLGVRTYASP